VFFAAPTVHALVADAAAMPNRKSLLLTSGAETVLHFFPFQWRISERPVPITPTAQALVADTAATPKPATGGRLRRGDLSPGVAVPALKEGVRAAVGRASTAHA
jgi:hypothetical protein